MSTFGRIAAIVTALALSACAFSAEHAFFTAQDGSTPFADGARFLWVTEDETQTVAFHLRDGAYDAVDVDHTDEPMRGVLFVAVPETPQDDYIVQWRVDAEDEGVAFAFMWRVGDEYRIATSPSRVLGREGESTPAADALCHWGAYRDCNLQSREDLLTLYRTLIYPKVVARDVTFEDVIVMRPLADGNRE